MNNFIDKSAKIGQNFSIGHNSVIMQEVNIGKNVTIGHNVVIYPLTQISDNVTILDNAVVGKQPSRISTLTIKVEKEPPCEIGEGSIIGTSAIIYAGVKIGKNCFIADLASIRERCIIKDHAIIGRVVTIEYDTTVGEYSRIMTHSQITGNMIIEDHVFFGGAVASTNDKYMTTGKWKGPIIKSGARIGANATIIGGNTIGKEAMIGAGAVVTSDIPDHKVAMGIPARVVKEVPLDQRLQVKKEEG
jgi:UDP-2-acetamido-3-amino-2,3-dideoxy-glucuronate N-acetyltransferase